MQRPYRPRSSNRREPVVEDLREKLNRIKQEKALNAEVGTKNLPPPDPAYNFLKDPLRGDGFANLVGEKKIGNKHENAKHEVKCGNKSHDVEQKNLSKPIEKSPRENRNVNFDKKSGASSGWQRQNWRSHTLRDEQQPRKWKDKTVPQQSTKQQSVNNIKVILSNESGERKCTIDETVLVQIPIITGKNHTLTAKPEKWSQKRYSDYNKQKLSGKNKETNEEDTNKQLKTAIANENKHQMKTLNENDQKAETIADGNQKAKINVNIDQKVETIANNDQKAKTIANNNQKAETIINNDQEAETTVNNNTDRSIRSKEISSSIGNDNKTDPTKEAEQKPAETIANSDQKAETVSNIDQKIETIANNEQQAKTIADNDQKAKTITNNDKKTETISNNDQKVETIGNNDQKAKTIANNDQKAETISNNDQKVETMANNDQKAKTIANNDQKTETVINNNTDQSISSKEISSSIGNDNKTEPTKEEEQKPAENNIQ